MLEHLSNCHGEVTALCGFITVMMSGGSVWLSSKLWGRTPEDIRREKVLEDIRNGDVLEYPGRNDE